jgi:glycine/D-amino acid oxidase-like deaminating enzyme
VQDRPLADYTPLTSNVQADIAVIGAGITGALVAYELTHAGFDVVVLDKEVVVSGSSSATSGLLLYDTDLDLHELGTRVGSDYAARAYRLGLQAIDRIELLCHRLGDACGFARRPSLYLASRDADVAALEREFRARRAIGLDVGLISKSDLRARTSFQAPAAIWSRGTAEVNCYRFAHLLLAAAASSGARIYARTPAIAVRQDAGALVIDVPGGLHVRCRRLVNATGYEASTHLHRKTANLASTWVVVSQRLYEFPGWPDRCLIWETARPYVYLRTTEDGRLLAGGEDEPGAHTHRSAGEMREKSARLIERARAMFPELTIQPEFCWAGTFATTDDGLPFIGESPECPNVWFALGYGGNGITFSVTAADILRDAFLEKDNPDAEIFRFARRTNAAELRQ